MTVSPVSIVNVGYRSTNYWVVSAGRSRILVDLGWPGTMGTLRANLNRVDIPLSEIRFGLATHYHIDHAGLAQDLKNAGVSLLLDDGSAFTGDLTHPKLVAAEDPDVVQASWQRLKEAGAKQVYGGHGSIRPLPSDNAPL